AAAAPAEGSTSRALGLGPPARPPRRTYLPSCSPLPHSIATLHLMRAKAGPCGVPLRASEHRPPHAKKSCALISASTRALTSALVLYMANEALHVAATPSRSIRGWAQWWP